MVAISDSRSAGPCLHRLIEAQAERTPDSMALAFEQDALSWLAKDEAPTCGIADREEIEV